MSMKKIIALALALCMALSMVAFAGFTDTTDVDAELQADIELVSALGLMTGNGDGTFNPEGTLTRGEAAVIIYRLKSGKSTIDASWGDASLNTYTDMASHWSMAYVNYGAALGLIAGYDDGTYRPEKAVTGVEMAKMLLNVAGYDTEKQGYGTNWPKAVLADAGDSGLMDDYGAAFTAAAPRKWVAKMVANMLEVQTVSYNSYTNALVKNTDRYDDPVTVGDNYGVETEELYAQANEFGGMGGSSANEDESDLNAAFDGTGTSYTITYEIPTELLGHYVKVYYKDNGNTANTLDAEDKIYAVVDNAEEVINTSIDKIYVHTSNGLMANGKVVDKNVKTTGAVNFFENLTAATTTPVKSGTSASYNNDGRAVELVCQEDVWYAFYNKVEYIKVPADFDQTEDEITLGSMISDVEVENVKFNDTLAEDDIIEIEKLNDGTYAVTKIDALRTMITSVSTSGSNVMTFKVGSSTYKEMKLDGQANTGVNSTFWAGLVKDFATESNLDETYDIYAVNGYVVYAEAYSSTLSGLNGDIAYLIAGYKASNTNSTFESDTDKVQVLLTDGSVAIYEYDIPDDETGLTVGGSNDFADGNGTTTIKLGEIYEYKLNKDGTIYFTQLASAGTSGDAYVVDDTAGNGFTVSDPSDMTVVTKFNMTVDGAVAYANEDTFFFVALTNASEDAEYTVIKASELLGKDLSAYAFTTTAAYVKDEETGLNTLGYAVLENKSGATDNDLPGAASAAGDWFITTAKPTTVVTSGDTVYTVAGINASGKKETLTINGKYAYDNTGKTVTSTAVTEDTMYEIMVKGDKTYLKALDEDIINDSDKAPAKDMWNKVLITASTKNALVLAGVEKNATTKLYELVGAELFDLADDAVITYVYGSLSLKTSGTPSSIPYTTLNDGTTEVTIGDETYTLYENANGTLVIDTDDTADSGWKTRKDATKDWTADNLKDCGTQTDSSYSVAVTADENIYSLVRINEDKEITDVIIKVTGSSDNTQVNVNLPAILAD